MTKDIAGKWGKYGTTPLMGRAYKDRPFRRVGMALLIAVAVHALVLGVGGWYFKDYVFTTPVPKITTEMLDRAVADAPIDFPAFSMSGVATELNLDTDIRSSGWERYRFTMAVQAWSWEPDRELMAPLRVPQPTKH